MAGRPQAPQTITNVVLTRRQLKNTQIVPRDVYSAMTDQMSWLRWLAEHRFIRNQNVCNGCNNLMSFIRRAEAQEGYSWACRPCNTRTGIRTGSFLANCGLKSEQIVMMMYYWVYEVKCRHVMLFEDIHDWHHLVNYNNFFRLECKNWLQSQQQVQLGGFDANGVPKYVEVDETYFFHRKYHRGAHRRRGKWVVGLVERDSGRCWLEVVQRRDAPTLELIICNHVLPGTIIVTDAWGGYQNVGNLQNGIYQHEVVVHAQYFVDPIHADIHTETIEGLWMHAKKKLRYQHGTSRGLFDSYLSEFQWRFSHKNHVFGQFLCTLSENYNI
jgi:transposase-like protein